jgi:superfamily I DNA and/or RNA helicase
MFGMITITVCIVNAWYIAARRCLWPRLRFSALVNSQATEPSTLVPLLKGAECCILAGDPKQLPPTVTSEKAAAAGLSQTLFSRLEAETDIPVFLLDRQYRMHPGINAFPSKRCARGYILESARN